MHPAIAPMVERAAYIGGCDGVAGVAGAKLVGVEPVGTMSHALILILGEERAWRGIDRILDAKTPRIALVDTFQDEKFGAVAAARVLGERLSAVRLDTPASRRGDLPAILREVRWELDHRGFDKVNLFITGGLDDREIQRLNPFADGYGVGTSISNAPVVDFALDIVEVDGHPRAKRGKLSGRKDLWLCPECGNRGISPAARRAGHCPQCGHRLRSLLEPLIADGRPKGPAPRPRELRERALREVSAAPDPFAAQA
jgi:nicotinate phosphoribosyltransferase